MKKINWRAVVILSCLVVSGANLRKAVRNQYELEEYNKRVRIEAGQDAKQEAHQFIGHFYVVEETPENRPKNWMPGYQFSDPKDPDQATYFFGGRGEPYREEWEKVQPGDTIAFSIDYSYAIPGDPKWENHPSVSRILIPRVVKKG